MEILSRDIDVDAIDVEAGLMVFDAETASLDELVSAHSDKQIILADSQKFKKKSYITYSSISSHHMVVTDNKIDSAILRRAAEKGIEILVA